MLEKLKADKESLTKYLKELELKANGIKVEIIRVQGAIIYVNQNIKDYKLEDECCGTQQIKHD